jgi:hypothetical protein
MVSVGSDGGAEGGSFVVSASAPTPIRSLAQAFNRSMDDDETDRGARVSRVSQRILRSPRHLLSETTQYYRDLFAGREQLAENIKKGKRGMRAWFADNPLGIIVRLNTVYAHEPKRSKKRGFCIACTSSTKRGKSTRLRCSECMYPLCITCRTSWHEGNPLPTAEEMREMASREEDVEGDDDDGDDDDDDDEGDDDEGDDDDDEHHED